jgi:hypothetical protein
MRYKHLILPQNRSPSLSPTQTVGNSFKNGTNQHRLLSWENILDITGKHFWNVQESAVTSKILDRSSVIGLERIRRFVRVYDQKGIREIRDEKITRVKIDEDAKDSMNPFGSRSQAKARKQHTSIGDFGPFYN